MRGAAALLLGTAAAWCWRFSVVGGVMCAGSAGFLAFEALRGWCALRACGVKTKF